MLELIIVVLAVDVLLLEVVDFSVVLDWYRLACGAFIIAQVFVS